MISCQNFQKQLMKVRKLPAADLPLQEVGFCPDLWENPGSTTGLSQQDTTGDLFWLK